MHCFVQVGQTHFKNTAVFSQLKLVGFDCVDFVKWQIKSMFLFSIMAAIKNEMKNIVQNKQTKTWIDQGKLHWIIAISLFCSY